MFFKINSIKEKNKLRKSQVKKRNKDNCKLRKEINRLLVKENVDMFLIDLFFNSIKE